MVYVVEALRRGGLQDVRRSPAPKPSPQRAEVSSEADSAVGEDEYGASSEAEGGTTKHFPSWDGESHKTAEVVGANPILAQEVSVHKLCS